MFELGTVVLGTRVGSRRSPGVRLVHIGEPDRVYRNVERLVDAPRGDRDRGRRAA